MSLRNKNLYSIIFSILAGILIVFGYAPMDMWYLAILGMIVFSFVFAKQDTAKKSALSTFIFAVTLNTGSLWWISSVINNFGQTPLVIAGLIIILFAAYLSFMPTIAGYLSHKIFAKSPICKNLLFFPCLWIISDLINGWTFTGFPWNWLAYTQIDSYFSGIAPIIGAEGVTFAVLIFCGGIGYSLARRKTINLIIPLLVFIVCAWCKTINYTDKLSTVKVALMQGNITTETKWDPEQVMPTLNTYTQMLKNNLDAEIMIWPESAIPLLENNAQNLLINLDNLLDNNKIGFITGIQYYDEENASYYNGMLGLGYIDNTHTHHYTYGEGNRYYKRHLVPIGEFVPFESIARKLGPMFNMPMSSFTRGDSDQKNIKIYGYNIASAICYEMAFNSELRDQINEDTNMIVTVSNDGWFNHTYGPYQHLAIARMRAIEFSKPVLRATNNGITAVIDEKGNIIKQAKQNIEVTLRSEISPTKGITPYAEYGRFPLIFIIGTIILSTLLLRPRNKKI